MRYFYLFLYFQIFLFISCTQNHIEKLTSYVNPFIGTDEDGHTFPGAIVPFGAVQLSPDNGDHDYNWCSGYHYTSQKILGFSHTHYSGTGAESLCDISVFPLANVEPTWESIRSDFSHADEKASPGYYSVLLKSSRIKAELTASMHCGFHRYTFPENNKSMLRLDLGFGNGAESRVGHNGDTPLECYFKKLNDHTIIGFRRAMGFVAERKVYFALETNKPFNDIVLFADGTLLTLKEEVTAVRVNSYLKFEPLKAGEELLVKVGISFASSEGALAGLKEIPDWDFEKVHADAELGWEKELQKIVVTSDDKSFKESFYTAVYHNYFAPFRYDDANGQYLGADQKVHTGKNIYTLSSLWDTYRATAPLYTLTQTERLPDIIQSYLEFSKQHGLLPSWELYFNEANVMPGYHAVPIIADAILKGVQVIDLPLAFEAMKNTANEDIRESGFYRQYGYVPDDLDPKKRGVTKTVEYAFDDWCIAQVAKKLGNQPDYEVFMKRSGYWKNVFDPETGFVRPKDSKGNWILPFDPRESVGFQEGNAWIYTWYVPQDVYGLADKMGGTAALESKLDSLYRGPQKTSKEYKNTGYYGLSEFTNEPSHHVPYLYSYVGKPWKTAEKVNHILNNFYNNTPNGLCGNDDCGQTSAWYVLSSLGFYPVNPANGEYVFGTPLVNNAVIHPGNGKEFIIKVDNLTKNNIYIQKAILNGRPYTKTFIRHTDIQNGGELVLFMGEKPSESWGTNKKDWPDQNVN